MTRSLNSLALAALAALCTSAAFASTQAYTFGTKSPGTTTDINFDGMQPKDETIGGTSPDAQQHLFCTDVGASNSTFGTNYAMDQMTAVVINQVGATLKIAAQGQGAPTVDMKAEVANEEGEITAGAALDEIDLAVAALGAKGFTVMAAVYADGTTAKTNAWAETAVTALLKNVADTAGAKSVDVGLLVAHNKAGAHSFNLLSA